ncbi:MAG: iron-containing alcohol dehydrogenase, partial [Actinomycetota bacterium]
MLPHVMRFNRDVVAQRYADVGEALGSEHDPEAGIAAVEKLSATVGTNKRLRELGATSDNINDLTQDALREAEEEVGVDSSRLNVRKVFSDDHGNWRYDTVIAFA